MGPRWISQIRANVQICWHICSPYVNVPWFGFGGPPDEDADVDKVALARIQWSVWENPGRLHSATLFNEVGQRFSP